MDIGERVKEVRLKLNLSQEEFAKKVGLETKTAISQWEKGKTEPNVSKLISAQKVEGSNPSGCTNIKPYNSMSYKAFLMYFMEMFCFYVPIACAYFAQMASIVLISTIKQFAV